MSTEKFNDVEPLRTPMAGDGYWILAHVNRQRDAVYLNHDTNSTEEVTVSVDEARALYEWLGKALPYIPSEADHLWAFYRGVRHCMHDTWQCPDCGYSEPWWEGSNAEHLTHKAAAMLAEREKEPQP